MFKCTAHECQGQQGWSGKPTNPEGLKGLKLHSLWHVVESKVTLCMYPIMHAVINSLSLSLVRHIAMQTSL